MSWLKKYDYYPFNIPDGDLDYPHFENTSRTHDWRNHVPEEIRENWDRLSHETKVCIVKTTSEVADAEEWE